MKMHQLKIGTTIMASCLFLFIAFYFLAASQIRYAEKAIPMIEGEDILAELNNITDIEQPFVSQIDILEKISLKFVNLGRMNQGIIKVQLMDVDDNLITDELEIEAALLQDGTYYEWVLKNNIENAKNKKFSIKFQSQCEPGMAPGIYYNSLRKSEASVVLNNVPAEGVLCFAYAGKNNTFLGKHFWKLAGTLEIILFIFLLVECRKHNAGKASIVYNFYYLWKRYKFLIQQLVSRDFKTKYKRSVLGYLWSFLNPLLTMIVQYVVFSTVFRSDIKNFPVYLLSGIVLFNFFSESVGQGLSAIVGNTALITKVYVPKYIYPITKVLSSSINLIISMIPLLILMIFTGTKITPAILLMPYVLICLLIFCIGMSLFLSAAMVFFRDTQYLWGIVSLAWMYATPLFYPESIIPAQYKFIHKLNPLYYIIKFARCLLIDGVSPEISLYSWCALFAAISLIIGLIVFKKTQDKFVLYL